VPQLHLPMFPAGVTPITDVLAFAKQDGQIRYFSGLMPVFSHAENDQAVDPGMLQVLERDIIPVLEQDVPNQPSAEKLAADPYLHRFTVVLSGAPG
jgi:hypothetical protein